MPLLPFRERLYESDHTRFIRELMERKPELAQEQRKARAMWWDKPPLDTDQQRRLRESQVAQQGYVYQIKG